jgi:L-lactate dehydrogenase (cytochrome)
MKRRPPRPRELAPLLQFRKPRLNATARRLEDALTIEDLRRIAKRRTPKAAFDYTDGAAEDELSLARARQAFRDIEFHPTNLRDVAKVDTGWQVLGDRVEQPFGIAPTGFTRLMNTEGEIAGARAAARAGILFALSPLGTPPSRTSASRRTRTAAIGFSSTCGRTGSGRWRWWSAPPRRASTRCW